MKNLSHSVAAMIVAACLALVAASAAYAWNGEDEANATSNGGSTGPVTVSPTRSAVAGATGIGKVTDSGNSSSFAGGGSAKTGPQVVSVQTGAPTNAYNEQVHVMGGLPSQAGAAKTDVQVGYGVASVTGNFCGPLKEIEEQDTEYLRTHLFKKDEKFTLKTQYSEKPVPYTELVHDHDGTVIMEPVLDPNGQPILVDGKPLMKPLREVIPFRKIYHEDGTVTYKGSSVRNRTRMTIGVATSNAVGVGGIGGSAAGSASLTNSSSLTGNQEMDLVGECDYGTFKESPDGKLIAVVDPRDAKIAELEEKNRRMDCKVNQNPDPKVCPPDTKTAGSK